MTGVTATGPSATAQWREVGNGAGSTPALLALPDAGDPDRRHLLRGRPVLARGPEGTPVFGLVVVLARGPRPGEPPETLATGARLTFEATIAPPATAIGPGDRPVFAREGRLSLRDGDRPLAEVPVSGSALRGALAAPLSAAATRAVLAALGTGARTGLVVAAEIGFRAEGAPITVRLEGDWGAIHADLERRFGPAAVIDRPALRAAFADLVVGGTIRLTDAGGGAPAAAPDEAFDAFLPAAAAILSRLPDGAWRLDARPPPGMWLDVMRRTAGGGLRRFSTAADLGDLLADVPFGGADHVRFVVGSEGTDAPGPAVRTVRTRPSRGATPGGTALALEGDRWKAVGAILQTGASPALSAAVLAASDTTQLRPVAATLWHGWVDDLVVLDPDRPATESVPVVGDPAAALWTDRVDPARRWYAPVFAPVLPDPAGDPAAAPFAFRLRRTGVTASGRPALHAQLRVTLRPAMSAETQAAAGQTVAVPTPVLTPSATLHLPFVDDADGRPKVQPFQGTVEAAGDGTLVATFEAMNDWARLLYGALAQPGFQDRPARLSVAYSFPADVPVRRKAVRPVRPQALFPALGGKAAVVPVVRPGRTAPETADGPHFDAATLTIRHAAGELRLVAAGPGPNGVRRLRADMERAARRGSVAAAVSSAAGAMALRPDVAVMAARPSVAVRPTLRPSAAVAQFLDRVAYVRQTVVREARSDLLVPCATHGAFYREVRDDGDDVALGCQDALMLGRADARAHEEMTDLADARMRVFRSLRQPGRFLVLPSHYRVARRAAGAGTGAFRPAIALYSVVDPDDDGRSRIVVEAVLEPDLPPFARTELLSALAAHAPAPVLEHPTEACRDVAFDWGLPPGLAIEGRALRVPNGFRVSLATDFAGALLLTELLKGAGIGATARFEMTDGARLSAALSVDLADLAGPWDTGPFDIVRDGATVRLTNRIERPVDVTEVLALRPAGAPLRVPVEARLLPQAGTTVALPAEATGAVPVYAVPPAPPAGLDELRASIDEVTTNVLFVDLVNHGEHGLARLSVRARLRGRPETRTVPMDGSPGHGEVAFVLPMTAYLADRTLEFEVAKTFSAGATETTPWLAWDLARDGNVVSLTWPMIAVAG